MKFRSDINGLRAIAVAGVLIFHFIPAALPGGFAGVDVFFVISGFLMTSIILGRIAQGSFGLISFYMSRANRIVPALTLLCVTLMILGAFFLDPADYRHLAIESAAAVSFLSNILFWRDRKANYFDASAHEKWLLHSWSLSAEWQFYILFPIVLVLLAKLVRYDAIRWWLLGVAVAGLGLSAFMADQAPTAAYYLLPARFWEMLAGGLVWCFARPVPSRWRAPLAYAGLALIVLSYLVIGEGVPWPGFAALLPVTGAAMVIWAGAERIAPLSNPASGWTGRVSYSLYLWHWPFVVLGNHLQASGDPRYILFAFAGSFACAAASYYLVERKIGRGAPDGGLGAVVRSPVVIAAVAAFGLSGAVAAARGLPVRAGAAFAKTLSLQQVVSRAQGYCSPGFDIPPPSTALLHCRLGRKDRPARGLLFGDSFAGQWEPFWDEIARRDGIAIGSINSTLCFPSLSRDRFPNQTPRSRAQCLIDRYYLRDHGADYDFVVLGGHWLEIAEGGFLPQVRQLIDQLAARGVTVIVMPSPILYDTDVNSRFRFAEFNRLKFDIRGFSRSRDLGAVRATTILQGWEAANPRVMFLDRAAVFGGEESYRWNGQDVPLSYDGQHISLGGSLAAARIFARSAEARSLDRRIASGNGR